MKKISRLSTLARLFYFFYPYWGWVTFSVILGALTVASSIGLLGTSAYLIATAALRPSVAELQVAIVGVRFFGISRAIFRYLERLVSHSVNFQHLARLRVWFYRKIEPLSPARLLEYQSGDILNRAIADIEMLENFYVRAVAPPLSALVIVAATGWFVGRYDPLFSLVLVLALLIAGIGLPVCLYWSNRRPGTEAIMHRATLHAGLLDAIQGMPDLVAYGQGENHIRQISSVSESLGRAQWKVNLNGSLANMLSLFLSGMALWSTLLLAVPQVGNNFSGVSLAVLALVILSSFEAVNPLTQAAQHLESSIQAGRRLFSIADEKPAVLPPQNPHAPPKSPEIHIRGLRFSYGELGVFALDGIDLDLLLGQQIALVGPSGSGKTSLVNLLLRFWEYQQGTVEVGGVDIRQYAPDDVRNMMAVVAQPGYLFSSTLRQNLLVARPGADDKDLAAAIKSAKLESLVASLPQGLDTWIGDRGYQLSGGERQRIIIARAILRNAPIWILDEPTANLDAVTERQLFQTLREVSRGKSVITIAHRLAGLEDMDEILVMSQGRIVERGTHAQLLTFGGLYSRMWQIQRETFR